MYFTLQPERKLYGEWSREISLGNTAAVKGRLWLDAAGRGNEIPLDGLENMHLSIGLNLTKDGNWAQSLDESVYAEQEEAARMVMAAALKKLILLRAGELGALDLDEEDAEAAVVAATGHSTLDFLKEYGPSFLPSLEELGAEYNGSGTFTAEDGMLYREGLNALRFMVDERMLVLSEDNGRSSIYRRKEEAPAVSGDAVTLIGKAFRPIYAQAAGENHNLLENLSLTVDGGKAFTVKALDYGYSYNRYVSLRDFAAAMNGSPKSFGLKIGNETIDITTGGSYEGSGSDNDPFEKTEREFDDENALYKTGSLKINTITVDGDYKPRYYTMIGTTDDGRKDAFMSVTDLAMMMDLHIVFDGKAMSVNTSEPFTVDMEDLRADGFYWEVHSALVGNVSTGEIYESHEKDLSVPIASTTKLMTYLCVMDAVRDGEISLDTVAKVSKKGEILSRTGDGVIKMQEGDEAPVSELLRGMLLPSSNECALTLAETVSGSEEAFVERMNAKARLLGLSDATIFYNAHGLPIYTENLSTSKIQNHMSAQDMFLLVKHILDNYPQIRDITSMKTANLPSFSRDVKNTNPLLYNLPEVFGLKTGTTVMSGACLVAAMDVVTPEGETQQLVAMEFGAEDSLVRATLCQELLLYARQRVEEGKSSPVIAGMPTTAEELVEAALKQL